jgi:type II secretory pathway pseudopilin PulG
MAELTGKCRYHPDRQAEAVCRICGAELCSECAQGGFCVCPRHHKPNTAWRIVAVLTLLALLPLGWWIAQINKPAALEGVQDFAHQTAQGVLERVKAAMMEYARDVGRYPTAGEGLEALIKGKRAADTPEPAPAAVEPSKEPAAGAEGKPLPTIPPSELIPGWRGPYLPTELWEDGFPDALGGVVLYDAAAKVLTTHDGKFRLELGTPPAKREARPEEPKSTTG